MFKGLVMNKIIAVFIVVFLCSIAYATEVTFQDGTDSYTGTDDSMLYNHDPEFNTNYNTDTTIKLRTYTDGANYNKSAVIKFDVSSISATATINSATLYIWYLGQNDCTNPEGYANTLGVYRAFKTWTNAGVTWNDWINPDSEWGTGGAENESDAGSDNSGDGSDYDRKATAEDTYTQPAWQSTGQFLDFDVTDAVQNWVDGTWTNNGLVLRLNPTTPNEVIRCYASSEYGTTSYRPKLVVDYTEAGGSTRRVFMLR
jgi:hypothetical protein